MCREGQTESPPAIIYANPNFIGDQVSFELKLNRGENDMELRRKLTSQEYKSYGNIQNFDFWDSKDWFKELFNQQ